MKLSKRILAVLLAGTMALALLVGCGSAGYAGGSNVNLVNVMLQLNNYDGKVDYDASLQKDADNYLAITRKLTVFEAAVAEESSVRDANNAILEERSRAYPWSDALEHETIKGRDNCMILVRYESNDAQCANALAWQISDLQEKGKRVTGIAISKSEDGRNVEWSEDPVQDEEGNLDWPMTKVEKTLMWVAVVTYENAPA